MVIVLGIIIISILIIGAISDEKKFRIEMRSRVRDPKYLRKMRKEFDEDLASDDLEFLDI